MEGERKIRVRVWLGYMGFIELGPLIEAVFYKCPPLSPNRGGSCVHRFCEAVSVTVSVNKK